MSDQTTAADRLYAECKGGARDDLPGLLDWLTDRLVHVHGDSPNVGFIVMAKERARRLRLAMDLYETERGDDQ